MQDMHLLAERRILSALKDGGLLEGQVNEMLDFRIGALFMPHGAVFTLQSHSAHTCILNGLHATGLGHLLGLDTHDVGGYITNKYPTRSELPGLKNLRTAR